MQCSVRVDHKPLDPSPRLRHTTHPYLSPRTHSTSCTHTSHHITQHTIQHTPITLTQPWFWVSILWYGAQSDTPGLIPRHRAEESQTERISREEHSSPTEQCTLGSVVVSGAVTVAGGWENHPVMSSTVPPWYSCTVEHLGGTTPVMSSSIGSPCSSCGSWEVPPSNVFTRRAST